MDQNNINSVKKLRELTGSPMGDCKKALEETKYDLEAARLLLKKQGLLVGVIRGSKDTQQGVVRANTSTKKGTIICLSCESDSVAKLETFITTADEISLYTIEHDIEVLEELETEFKDAISSLMSTIKESIKLSYYSFIDGEHISIYNHHNNKVAVLVKFNKEFDEKIGKNIAMQIASMNPLFVDYDDIPQSILDAEKKLAEEKTREQEEHKDKPDDIIEKISKGRLDKVMDAMTLLNQEFTQNSKQTVRQYLESVDEDLKVITFRSFKIG